MCQKHHSSHYRVSFGNIVIVNSLLNIIPLLQAAKEQTQDLVVKTNKLQGEK